MAEDRRQEETALALPASGDAIRIRRYDERAARYHAMRCGMPRNDP